jgi:hypothetical protein
LIGRFLWQRADRRLAELEQAGEEGLIVWDESVIEKPERIAEDRLVCRAIKQGAPIEGYQARLLQSTRRSPHLGAWHVLAGGAPAGAQRPSCVGRHAASGRPAALSLGQARGRGTYAEAMCGGLGTARAAYL